MSSLKLIIGNKNYSSWSLRPWVVLKHIGVSFEEQLIPLYLSSSTRELSKYSPSGKVPVLIDGNQVIWDSLAICEYLNEKFRDARLWPQDSVARARARSISAEMHAGFHALRENMPMNIRRKTQVSIPSQVQKEIERISFIFRSCREEFGKEGKFLFGDFSIADAMYVPVAFRFRTYGVRLNDPSQSYVDSLLDIPCLREWIEAAEIEPYMIASSEK